jgi:protein O-mannosyl-transferase
MKPKQNRRSTPNTAGPAPSGGTRPGAAIPWWAYGVAAVAALGIAFQVYSPALDGPFLFDDAYLPMNQPNPPDSWQSWVIGVRPVLSLSYWLNWSGSGNGTHGYHVFNVMLHAANALLVFLILRKLLRMTRPGGGAWLEAVAGFGAALFLLHPVQTESVAYIAGRSESLSTLFYFGAYTVFLYRRRVEVSWAAAAAIVGLFGMAVLSKEHAVTLPLLLLLTDYFFNPGFSFRGIRANWRLYGILIAGAVAGAVFVLRLIAHADSAGFGLKEFTWYQYLFTQGRAFFVYLRLFVLPVGQNIDYAYPVSRTILDHGALFGMAGAAGLLGAAMWFRKRFPLACFGLLAFALMLAPTSSILPIKDPLAERRMYLPLIGLLLVVAEFLVRLAARRAAAAGMAVVLLGAGVAAYARNSAWSSATAMWEDTVSKSPGNARAHFQLGYAYFQQNRCPEALKQYETVARLEKPDYRLLMDWALACDCAGRPEDAMARLEQAAALEQTAHVYANMAMLEARRGRAREAELALDKAEKIDPKFEHIFVYRGNLRLQQGNRAEAAAQFRRALGINPRNQAAVNGLALAAQAR